MKIIKFRIWNPEENKMLESGATPMMLHSFFEATARLNTQLEMQYQQFTGLLDKKGKEIYEGDILLASQKIKEKNSGQIRTDKNIFSVEWGFQEGDYEQSECFAWLENHGNYKTTLTDHGKNKYSNRYWDCLEEKYEVIGNIYENPELLAPVKEKENL